MADNSQFEWNGDLTVQPHLDAQLSNKLVGKQVIVGYTYLKNDGSVDHQTQRHGTIIACSAAEGVRIQDSGTKDIFSLPPDLRSCKPAAKGTYRLRSTGEEVVNPDYVMNWLVAKGRAMPAVRKRKYSIRDVGFYNLYGIGTKMYGRADKHPDGSIIATKWITLIYIPLIPLASYRVQYKPSTISFGFGLNGDIIRAEREPLNVRQIARTYPLVILLLAILTFIIVRILLV